MMLELELNYYLAAARDILLGIYKGNEQKLGDWGFEADQSTAPQTAQAKAANTAPTALGRIELKIPIKISTRFGNRRIPLSNCL
jgi:hypothetical protein